jgi:hypothetical protein
MEEPLTRRLFACTVPSNVAESKFWAYDRPLGNYSIVNRQIGFESEHEGRSGRWLSLPGLFFFTAQNPGRKNLKKSVRRDEIGCRLTPSCEVKTEIAPIRLLLAMVYCSLPPFLHGQL